MPPWDEKGKLSQPFNKEAMTEAKNFKATDWDKFRKIEEEATKDRSRAAAKHEKTAEGKVGREIVRQINKAGSVSRDLTLGGSDKFHARTIKQAAENVVEAQQQLKLTSIDIKETVKKVKLLEKIETRTLRETTAAARREFNSAAKDRSRDR